MGEALRPAPKRLKNAPGPKGRQVLDNIGYVYGLMEPETRRLRYIGSTTRTLSHRMSCYRSVYRTQHTTSPLLRYAESTIQIPDTLRIDPVIIVSMHETENRLSRFYPGDSTGPSMESMLDLVDIVNGSRPCAGPFTQEASRLQPGG